MIKFKSGMCRASALSVLAASMLGSVASAQDAMKPEPSCAVSSSAPEITENRYDVLRNGKSIGSHVMTFTKSGSSITVRSETHMKVKVLFLSAFKYHFVSEEKWCGTELQSVDTKVDDNGKDWDTKIRRGPEAFKVTRILDDNPEEKFAVDLAGFPTSHWDQRQLKASLLLNTIKGKAEPSTTAPCAGSGAPAFTGTCYEVKGEYDYSTYYNTDGQWQGMSFYRGKKNFVEFRCIDCSNTLYPDP